MPNTGFAFTITEPNSTLSSLSTSTGSYLTTTFSPSTTAYYLVILSDSALPTLTFEASDEQSTIKTTQDNLNEGTSATAYTLESEVVSGASSTVTIVVSRGETYSTTYTLTVLRTVTFSTNPVSQTLTNYNGVQEVSAASDLPGIASITATVDDLLFTTDSGTAYGLFTNNPGVVSRFSITAEDASGNLLTDFSNAPVTIELTLPNASTGSTIYLYKVDPFTGVKVDPQPSWCPAPLTYNSSSGKWKASLFSLSTYIAQDQQPPAGVVGGDPHIRNCKGEKITLPNSWGYFRLYEDKQTEEKIMIRCAFLERSVMTGLHRYDEETGEIRPISLDPRFDIYVKEFTYMTELELFEKDELVVRINMLTGEILYQRDDKIIDNIPSEGVLSITHGIRYTPTEALASYALYLRSNNLLTITVDSFWDDINNIALTLSPDADLNLKHLEGEIFEHSDVNNEADLI